MHDAIEDRVRNLELENRRLRGWILLAITIPLGVFLMGQSTDPSLVDELRIRKLMVVDEAGRMRAVLFSGEYGTALAMVDEEGKQQLSLGANPAGRGLTFSDE